MKLPVFATGTSPAGPFKNGPGLVGSAVACGNVVCQPGDAIIGDSDGIVVVARDRIADLITLVQAQEAIEDRMRERIRSLA
jgi:regulator of RNase E activity RraA